MRPFDYLLYAGVIIGWSTSWYPLSLQMGTIPAEVSLFWRFAAAALLTFAIARGVGVALRYGRADHLRFACLGVVLFSTNFAFFYNASLYGASGLLAVILSTTSLVNVLMVAVVSRRRPPVQQLAASVTGLAGLGVIFLPELRATETIVMAILLGGAGTLLFCTGNLLSAATQQRGVHVLASTCWGMLYGTAFMGLVSLVRGHEFTIDLSPLYLGSLAWLVIVSSVLALASFLTLVGRIGPGRAGYATVIFPVFALLISTFMEGYQWSLLAIAGLVLVMAGNVIMIRAREQQTIRN